MSNRAPRKKPRRHSVKTYKKDTGKTVNTYNRGSGEAKKAVANKSKIEHYSIKVSLDIDFYSISANDEDFEDITEQFKEDQDYLENQYALEDVEAAMINGKLHIMNADVVGYMIGTPVMPMDKFLEQYAEGVSNAAETDFEHGFVDGATVELIKNGKVIKTEVYS